MASRNPSVERLKAVLKAIPPQLVADLSREIFAEAERLAAVQRTLVPVDTGALRDSIRVEAGATPLQAVIKAGGKATTVKIRKGRGLVLRAAGALGLGIPDYDYARAQEFGTVTQEGRSFFFGPYRKGKRAMRTRVRKKAKASMKKVAPIE